MRKMKEHEGDKSDNSQWRKRIHFIGAVLLAVKILIVAAILSGCTEDVIDKSGEYLAAAGVEGIFPANFAESVEVNPIIGIVFKTRADPATLAASSLTLNDGSSDIPGKVITSGKTALFTYDEDLKPMTRYVATFVMAVGSSKGEDDSFKYSWNFRTGKEHRDNSISVVSVSPVNNSKNVAVGTNITVNLSRELNSWMQDLISVSLMTGSTRVDGKLSFSDKTVIFYPTSALAPNKVYTGRFSYSLNDWANTHNGNSEDDKSSKNYTWSFTTAGVGGTNTDVTPPVVSSVVPANNATSVAVTSTVKATFSEPMNSSTVTSSTFTLKKGSTSVAGTVAYSGNVATFTPSAALTAGTVYSATVTTGVKDAAGNAIASAYNWSFTTSAPTADVTPPAVASVAPVNNASSVAINSKVTATFSEAMNSGTITTTTFSLKQGSTNVAGTVAYSGNTATFTPASNLAAGSSYIATVTTGVKDAAGNALASAYSWNFTTAAAADVTPPTVVSVVPASNATSVAVSSKITATFSESMTAGTISTTTFSLKQGSTNVAGTVAYSGNTATFTPSSNLAGGSSYTATVTTGVKDAAGNALASAYSWNFTTAAAADVTPPNVVTVVPASNATSIAVNTKITGTFSEAMNASSITSSTFSLKKGSTAVSGTVTYSGNVATFTPSSPLTEGSVYTATFTTGVKDLAGNALASNYSWNFTTVAPPAGVSFGAEVAPVLINQCNGCHKHNWTVSSNSSTFYTNLVNAGYVNPTSPTSSKIYSMLSSGHASSIPQADRNKILTWMSEGSKNN